MRIVYNDCGCMLQTDEKHLYLTDYCLQVHKFKYSKELEEVLLNDHNQMVKNYLDDQPKRVKDRHNFKHEETN